MSAGMSCDVLIVGGGLGGIAAALAAARLGRRVILTEPTRWIGGQLTAQGVPLDEHPWIEQNACSASYARFRSAVRAHYRDHYPLSSRARSDDRLNPGLGDVSRLCHEPRVAVRVLENMLAPHEAAGRIVVLREHSPVAAEVDGDRVRGVVLERAEDGSRVDVAASYVLDATELGDLLELARVEHVIGSESRDETGEPHALDGPANPIDQVAITWAMALDHDPDGDHRIDRPSDYAEWIARRGVTGEYPLFSFTQRNSITGEEEELPLFPVDDGRRSLWEFRRIIAAEQFADDSGMRDITMVLVNQNDYWGGPIVGVDAETSARNLAAAKAQSRAFLYWLQHDAPRPDGGTGFPGLRLRPDVTGTVDGFAMFPYVRESRRIRAEFTVLEQHIGADARPGASGAEQFADSVGIGSHRLDLHPSTGPRPYLDLAHWPYQLALGSMIPVRVENLLPACKNIGVTHITNGAYRVHPMEWNIGEVAGALAAVSLESGSSPRAIRNDPRRLADFQDLLSTGFGIPLAWPRYEPYGRHDHGPWPDRISW